MPYTPVAISLNVPELSALRDQFALAIARAWFTANPNHPGPEQEANLCKSIYHLADAMMRAREESPE